MKRIYCYPKVPALYKEIIRYTGLLIGLAAFWNTVLFYSEIQYWLASVKANIFNTTQQSIEYNQWGPYSDALAKNFNKTTKNLTLTSPNK